MVLITSFLVGSRSQVDLAYFHAPGEAATMAEDEVVRLTLALTCADGASGEAVAGMVAALNELLEFGKDMAPPGVTDLVDVRAEIAAAAAAAAASVSLPPLLLLLLLLRLCRCCRCRCSLPQRHF